ncbi:serine hydrolase domain-containing protein [Micromonospora sp. M12]
MDLAQAWAPLLEQLDRQVSSGRSSPDTATLSDLMSTYRVPGVSIAVGHVSGRVWAAGYGVTGGAAATPVTADTAFAACSISKHVAAFGALLLVRDGVLDLDTDVAEYLTSWRLLDREGRHSAVTVRQLLAHTAGLSDTWYRGYDADGVPSLVQVLDGSGPTTTPPVRAALLPGSRFRYSGSHYSVLQQLMADVTGTPFEDLVRTMVLEPLSMTDSSFDQRFPHQRSHPVARGHHGGGTGFPAVGGCNRRRRRPGSGAPRPTCSGSTSRSPGRPRETRSCSTVTWPPRCVDRRFRRRLRARHRAPRPRRVSTVRPHRAERRLHLLLLRVAGQRHGCRRDDQLRGRLGAAGQHPAAADRRYASRITAEPPGDVTGRYLLRDDYPIDVALTDGQLTFSAAAQPPVVLLAGPDGRYLHPGLDLEVRFLPSDGQRHTLELRQEGSRRPRRDGTDRPVVRSCTASSGTTRARTSPAVARPSRRL